MNNVKIVVSPNHPLLDKITDNFDNYIVVDPVNIYELDPTDFDTADYIYDFTCFDTETKEGLIESLGNMSDSDIITDLSVNWGEYILGHYERAKGAFAGSFWSPKSTIEFVSKDDYIINNARDVFKVLGLELLEVSTAGIGFHYPRVISMIINEAFFSQEEDLASNHDIDTGMKYGVNYPHGPFEWVENIGHDKVTQLLDELMRVTGDPRYRVSRKLRIHV
jgi:3-hydroxybutyryl-CoA dehydrogenase